MSRAMGIVVPHTLAVAVALGALAATPTMARPLCSMLDTQPGLTIEFDFSFGERDRETQEIFDKMELRKRGVNARTVTRTPDGCLEAFVQNPDGSWRTEYYDKKTFVLVY